MSSNPRELWLYWDVGAGMAGAGLRAAAAARAQAECGECNGAPGLGHLQCPMANINNRNSAMASGTHLRGSQSAAPASGPRHAAYAGFGIPNGERRDPDFRRDPGLLLRVVLHPIP